MKVLDEDEYIAALSEIIKRDFFPDLEQLEAQVDYWRAVQEGDFTKYEQASRRLMGERENALSKLGVNESIGLDQFQQKYTSEDNESFSKILEKMNKEREVKYSWIKEQESQFDKLGCAEVNLIASSEDQAKHGMKSLIVIPENKELSVQTWHYKGKNNFMYNADSTNPSTMKSNMDLFHDNTRLIQFKESTIDASQDIHLNGSVVELSSGSMYRSNIQTKPISKVNYEYVSTTPILRPGHDVQPIMTWGLIQGTPLQISSDTPSFRIPPTPKREEIAKQLSLKAARETRTKATADSTPNLRRLRNNLGSKSIRASGLLLSGNTPARTPGKTPRLLAAKDLWNTPTPRNPKFTPILKKHLDREE